MVMDWGGSFLVEYGVGCLKVVEFEEWGDFVWLVVMWVIKVVLDFLGIMNFGVVFF